MKNSRAMIILFGLVLGCVFSLANCGRQSDEDSGNPSSYPGNFLNLCAKQDKSAELQKTFNALLDQGETCLDAHTRLMALDEIDLSGKDLTDIRPLASFIAVKTLYLDHNRIGSLAALEGLYKLEKLDVSWNDIDDISFLDKLARLETFYVFGNPLGNKVAKTADNCPYQNVGKGLREFCTPPASKRKKPRVIVVKKNPAKSTPSRSKSTSSNKDSSSQSSQDDSAQEQQSESPSSQSQNSQSQNSQNQDVPEQDPTDHQPVNKTAKPESPKAEKTAKDPTERKRAWEKDTSFLPPDDDENDDWGEEVGQDRGLVADMAADDRATRPDQKDVDEAMAKEADKALGDKTAKTSAGAKAKAQRENPFATTNAAEGGESLAGQQTIAHSWDQAIGRAFTEKSGPAEQSLELDSNGLGQTTPGRRVPATDLFGEAFGYEGGDASGLEDGDLSGTSKDQNSSLLGMLTELYPRPRAAKKEEASSPKSWFDRLAMSFTGSKSDATSPAKNAAKNKSVGVQPAGTAIKVPAKVRETGAAVVAKTTRQTAAPIKSFLAYCLDHSDQPAIAHTIKVLTMTGESCIDSFRRLSALKRLNLAKRQLTDIAPLASFKNLEQLDLADNRITSIKPLTGLQKLTWLNLDRNDLGDISHLSRLAALSHLTAEHNRIFSLKPLSGLKNLGTIAVKGNPIAKDAAKNSITCPASAASATLRSFCQL